MTEPPVVQPDPQTPPDRLNLSGDGRLLSPRLRIYLYFTAGIIIALWFSLEILGAAGFAAFTIGMIVAQVVWRFRPKLNGAFAAGLATYMIVLLVWSVAIGPPRPTQRNATETAVTSAP